MNAALQDAAVEAGRDLAAPTLFWVAVYLVQLEWGGHEEGDSPPVIKGFVSHERSRAWGRRRFGL